MKTVFTLLIGMAIGALATFFGYPVYEMRGAMKAPECKAVVKLSLSGGQVQTEPPNTCLHKGRTLTWEVTAGHPQDRVEIDFKTPDPKGPFPKTNPNDKEGHYETTGSSVIETKPAGKKGRFEYKVKWTPYGGTTIESPDPAVCIRGG